MTLEMEGKGQLCELLYEVSAIWTCSWLLTCPDLTVSPMSGHETITHVPTLPSEVHLPFKSLIFGPFPGVLVLWSCGRLVFSLCE